MIELAGEIETTEDLRRFLIDVEARLHNVSRPTRRLAGRGADTTAPGPTRAAYPADPESAG